MAGVAALEIAAAPIFVVVWSTGFVVARVLRGEVDPNLFLAVRFALTALLFVPLVFIARARWPSSRDVPRHLAAGVLIQGIYLGGGYWAVANGLPAAVMALIGALQPLLVALLARAVIREQVRPRTWLGLLIGVAGVVLVIAPRLASGDGSVGSPLVLAVAFVGIVSMTAGTLVQKTSLAGADLRAASAIQNFGAAIACAVFALALGEDHWAGGATSLVALGWAAVFLSGGGTTLLVWMVRRGAAARVSALLLLVPPLVAVETFLLFGDTLTVVQVAGFAVAIAGVWLARS
jgi:drug/metabolite transporter (DMT)-like permease